MIQNRMILYRFSNTTAKDLTVAVHSSCITFIYEISGAMPHSE